MIDTFVNSNWVDTRCQQYSTHLHTNSTQNNTMKQNTQNRTHITIRIHKHNHKIFQIITNKMRLFLIYLFLQMIYMFKADPPPTIRST